MHAVAAMDSDSHRPGRVVACSLVVAARHDEDAVAADAKAGQTRLAHLADVAVDGHEVFGRVQEDDARLGADVREETGHERREVGWEGRRVLGVAAGWPVVLLAEREPAQLGVEKLLGVERLVLVGYFGCERVFCRGSLAEEKTAVEAKGLGCGLGRVRHVVVGLHVDLVPGVGEISVHQTRSEEQLRLGGQKPRDDLQPWEFPVLKDGGICYRSREGDSSCVRLAGRFNSRRRNDARGCPQMFVLLCEVVALTQVEDIGVAFKFGSSHALISPVLSLDEVWGRGMRVMV